MSVYNELVSEDTNIVQDYFVAEKHCTAVTCIIDRLLEVSSCITTAFPMMSSSCDSLNRKRCQQHLL